MRISHTLGTLMLTASLFCSAVPGQATPPPRPSKLITVPAVQQWSPGTGTDYRFHGREIIVQPGNDELTTVAHTFAADLTAMTGKKPSVRVGSDVKPGSMVLKLADQGHGPESYRLQIDKALTITGTTAHGAFNGTRTVLQLLAQHARIPRGTVTDWPEYEVRSVLWDQTPRHMSLAWWENFFKHMSYVKLNDTNLYLDGVGLDKTEMKAIDALAQKYYVKLVPQINMPSHMAVLLPSHPEYQLKNTDGSLNPQALDLTNSKAWQWSFQLIDQYIGLFSSDEWHIGTDEFPGWPGTGDKHPQLDQYAKKKYGAKATFADLFAAYQNAAIEHVESHGKKARVWNDMIRQSSVIHLKPSATVEYWIQHPDLPGLLSAADLARRGNSLVNAHVDWLYYDQSRRNLDPRELYEKFEVTTFHHQTSVPKDRVRGARMPIWLAWINTPMESDAEVLHNIRPSMYALAQKTWASPQLVSTWDEFRPLISTVGLAPGLRPESANTIQPNPATFVNQDHSVSYFARDVQGNLWTGKQSQPGVTHFTKELVARNVAGDPVVTALPDGRWQVVARTQRDRLLVATQDAPNALRSTAKELKVALDSTPAAVPGKAIVNSRGRLLAVDLQTGASQKITQGAIGSPGAHLADGGLTVACATTRGSLLASQRGTAWHLSTSPTKLLSTPLVVPADGKLTTLAVSSQHTLLAGTAAGRNISWSEVAHNVVGQPDVALGPKGHPQAVVRTTKNEMMHLWREGATWKSAVAAIDVVSDPTIAINHLDEPYMYAQTGRLTQLVAQKTGGKYYTNHLAESTVGRTAATFDSHPWPIYFVATTYGDLQTGSKWGNLWQWGRDFAIGTMSYPDDDLTPDQFTTILHEDQFTKDTSARYRVIRITGEDAPKPVIQDGNLSVTGDQPFYTTVVSDVPVAAGDTVVMTRVTKQLAQAAKQNSFFVGFVRSDKDYSMMWSSAVDHRIGFDTRSAGTMTPNGGYGNVPVVVKPGDRIATVLTGNWLVGYVERDGVWHRVHAAIANGRDDLRDPAVRAKYRYAIGLRGDKGTLAVDDMVAAER